MTTEQAKATPNEAVTGPEPQTAEGYVERGWTHYSKKEYYRSEADFRKAAEMAPNSIDTMYGLGMVLQASGRQQDAIQTFEKVIKMIETTPPEDTARANMLVRLSRGHINRMKTGDWHLEA